MKNIVILVSGRGSNMEAIVRACGREGWEARDRGGDQQSRRRRRARDSRASAASRQPSSTTRLRRTREAFDAELGRVDRRVRAGRRGAGRLHAHPRRRFRRSASTAAWSTSTHRCCPRFPGCTRTGARSRRAARSPAPRCTSSPASSTTVRSSARPSVPVLAGDSEQTWRHACSPRSTCCIRARSRWLVRRRAAARGRARARTAPAARNCSSRRRRPAAFGPSV